ncbi:ABC transporter permease [Leifsonia kafniensis]|uniref:ABC transporter permease n=1 Tax=Leifsonia kafniensis TaxID=475957 RepID=A0ABP7KLP1_9MICO
MTDAHTVEAPLVAAAPRGPALVGAWRRYSWIVSRVALAVLTLLIVSFVIYFATILLPGDAAQAVLGRNASEQALAALREQLGLNASPVVRYFNWLGGVVTGDFGQSLISHEPVTAAMWPRVLNTLLLVGLTAVIAVPLALAVGISAGVRQGRWWDGIVNTVTIILAGLPEFVVALLLVVVFSTGLFHVLPAVVILAPGASPISFPAALVLPIATLVIITVPYLIKQMRSSLIESLSSEYVTMAELKGLPQRVVVFRHAVRNSLIPSIQATALSIAFLIGGSVVVEFLFQYPGMGLALTSAVTQRDIPVLQFLVLVMAAGYVGFNLIADILTVLATPKLRTR